MEGAGGQAEEKPRREERLRRDRVRRARKPSREEGAQRWPFWGGAGRRRDPKEDRGVVLEVGGAWRWGPNRSPGGGAGETWKRRSRKERRVLSLSRNQARGLDEDRSSLPRLGLGGGTAVRVGLARRCHSHLKKKEN